MTTLKTKMYDKFTKKIVKGFSYTFTCETTEKAISLLKELNERMKRKYHYFKFEIQENVQ